MENITVLRAAELCGGILYGNAEEDVFIQNIVINSREVMPGDLFAAYRGEHADGHNYIPSAFERGAACCLAEYVPEGVSGPVIVVPDVQLAMEKLAKAYRAEFSIPVVGITGSVGKTTAKEMIASVLSRRYRTLKTEGNLNNRIGVPMMLARLSSTHQAAVIEMGISEFGEMTILTEMVRPTAAVFTVIGHAHLEFLHNLDGVLRAKTEMLALMADDAPVVVNGDDEKLHDLQCRQPKYTFGLSPWNDFRAETVAVDENGISCDIVGAGRRIPVRVPAIGHHLVYAVLAAAAIGVQYGLTDEEIAAGVADFRNVGRRGELIRTSFVTMIDDSYNANPDSVRSGIDTLVQLPGERHICILGDMLELGGGSGDMHAGVGRYAAERGADLVLTAGRYGQDTARGAGDKGRFFDSRDALIRSLPELLCRGDCLLVKASKGSHFEMVSAAIRKLAEEKEAAPCGAVEHEAE